MRVIFIGSWIALGLIVILLVWGRVASKQAEAIKPWITYERLLYLAERCDKYQEQTGTWPSSFAQLWESNPDMNDPWSKDAWGREFVLVGYNESLGYGEIISYGRDGKPGGDDADRDFAVRFPSRRNADWNKKAGLGLKQPRIRP